MGKVIYSMSASLGGAGTPFFPSLVNPINLALVETRRFGSGVVYLRYRLQPAVRVQAAEPE